MLEVNGHLLQAAQIQHFCTDLAKQTFHFTGSHVGRGRSIVGRNERLRNLFLFDGSGHFRVSQKAVFAVTTGAGGVERFDVNERVERTLDVRGGAVKSRQNDDPVQQISHDERRPQSRQLSLGHFRGRNIRHHRHRIFVRQVVASFAGVVPLVSVVQPHQVFPKAVDLGLLPDNPVVVNDQRTRQRRTSTDVGIRSRKQSAGLLEIFDAACEPPSIETLNSESVLAALTLALHRSDGRVQSPLVIYSLSPGGHLPNSRVQFLTQWARSDHNEPGVQGTSVQQCRDVSILHRNLCTINQSKGTGQ